jgi:hypothetical protein
MKRLLFPALLFLGCLGTFPPASANEALLPSSGVSVAHYESLWSKSPFAVATTEPAADASSDFTLVGTARFDGVSYASLIDNKKQQHLLLSTRNSDQGLTLVSINSTQDAPASAIITENGKSLRLVLSQAASSSLAPHVTYSPVASVMSMAPGVAPDPSCPPPPASGRIPLLFQALASANVPLNADQKDRISQLRQDFVAELGPYPNPNDPSYQKRWQQAQTQADDSMRAILGQDKFTAYEISAMQSAQAASPR